MVKCWDFGMFAVYCPPGKSHERRSLVGCSPWGCKESDTTEQLHFHFSLSCIGEGNGNPLQCSCLKNPRDRGAWWAAVYGVAQSQTRLKRLSSSGSSSSSDGIVQRSPQWILEQFPHVWKTSQNFKLLTPIPFPYFQPKAIINLPSISIYFPLSTISCKWSHDIWYFVTGFFYLA